MPYCAIHKFDMDYSPEILSVFTRYTFQISQDNQLTDKVGKSKDLQQKLVSVIPKTAA